MYPTKEQEESLSDTLEKCRFVYNKSIEKLRNENLSMYELQHYGVELKKEFPELNKIYAKALQYQSYKIFSSIKSIGNKGMTSNLRFKNKNRFKTFTYNQKGFRMIYTNKRYNYIALSKIGEIKVLMHKEISEKVKQVNVKKYSSGKWFISLIVNTQVDKKKVYNNNAVGIDLGLIDYVYDSDGKRVNNPRFLSNQSKNLKKLQKRLSHKKIDSKNREKSKRKFAIVNERIHNKRINFLHHVSNYYIKNYDIIVVEKLKLLNMVKNRHLSKAIYDASWSSFIRILKYKAERAGIKLIEVESYGTTQECSKCGKKVNKKLWNRTHQCSCGVTLPRDYNSAIVILNRGLGQGLTEFKPIESAMVHENIHELSVDEVGNQIIDSPRRKIEIKV